MQVGFKALAARYGVEPAQPLRVDSVIGTVRANRDTGRRVASASRGFSIWLGYVCVSCCSVE